MVLRESRILCSLVDYLRDVRASKRSMEESIMHTDKRRNRSATNTSVKHLVLCRDMIHLVRQQGSGELSIFDLRMHRKLAELVKPFKSSTKMMRFDVVRDTNLIWERLSPTRRIPQNR